MDFGYGYLTGGYRRLDAVVGVFFVVLLLLSTYCPECSERVAERWDNVIWKADSIRVRTSTGSAFHGNPHTDPTHVH